MLLSFHCLLRVNLKDASFSLILKIGLAKYFCKVALLFFRSVVRYSLTVARYNSFIDSNALFCCDRYRWSLDDLLCSNINFSDFIFANTHHKFTSDKMKQTALFLYEILCTRQGVFGFCHDRNILSRSQVDDIIAFLACQRSCVVYCTLLTAHFTLARCTLSFHCLCFITFNLVYLLYDFL